MHSMAECLNILRFVVNGQPWSFSPLGFSTWRFGFICAPTSLSIQDMVSTGHPMSKRLPTITLLSPCGSHSSSTRRPPPALELAPSHFLPPSVSWSFPSLLFTMSHIVENKEHSPSLEDVKYDPEHHGAEPTGELLSAALPISLTELTPLSL